MGFFGSSQQASQQATSDAAHISDVEVPAGQLASAASAPAQQPLPYSSHSSSSAAADAKAQRAQSAPAGKHHKPGPGQQSQAQGLTASQQQDVQSIMRLVHVMDSAFTIPGINRKVGLDAIIGLVPYAGDVAGGAVGTYIVSRALKYHLPKRLVLRMLVHQAIDSVFGIVPFLGDIFDIGFKANTRNAKLLQAHLEQPKQAKRADTCFLVLFFLLIVLVPVIISAVVIGAVVLIILAALGKL